MTSSSHTFQVSVQAAQSSVDLQILRDAGYLVVTDAPFGAKADGTGDSTAGINAAIKAGRDQRRAVYFPSGTYLVSDTIFVLKWDLWNTSAGASSVESSNHQLFGCSTNRPILKLSSSSLAKFGNASDPRPVVLFHTFAAVNASGTAIPPNPEPPYATPANFVERLGNGFNECMQNFVIDTNGNPGAIGVSFGTCQNSYLNNIRVVGTGSYACFNGVGGTQGSADLEGEGGQYGLIYRKFRDFEPGSGSAIVGLRLHGQTVACVEASDYCPQVYVGFHFQKPAGGTVIAVRPQNWATCQHTPVLIDGILETPSGTAIVNPESTLYARNVYVTGTNDLIQTGALATVTGSGAWKRIVEYSATNPNGAAYSSSGPFPQVDLEHMTVVDGVVSSAQQWGGSVVQSNAAPPPGDLWSRHLLTSRLPFIDSGPFVDVRDHGVTPYEPSGMAGDLAKLAYRDNPSPVDHLPGLNAAISAAAAAGHNRVFLPRGIYYISASLNLQAHTQLFGPGQKIAAICSYPSWLPTTGVGHYLVTTPDDAAGTASVSNLTLLSNSQLGTVGANGTYSGDRFSFLLWRVGRRSFTFGIDTKRRYFDETVPTNERYVHHFTGNGGGRHYWVEEDGRGNGHPGYRCIKADSTHEPLVFYGPSMEASKGVTNEFCAATNAEFVGCSNVRMYASKREGRGGTAYFTNCINVAHYGAGVQMVFSPDGQLFKVSGTSNGVLIAVSTVQSADAHRTHAMLVEEVTVAGVAQPRLTIPWPQGIALYKRGVIDDSAVTHT